MSFLLKRKQLVLFALVVTLCAAVFVNWYYTNKAQNLQSPEAQTTEVKTLGEAEYVNATTEQSVEVSLLNSSYFSKAKLNRTTSYDENKEMLTAIIESRDSGESAVKSATEQLNALTERKTLETDIENLITAKLNSDCLAVLGDGTAEILVSEKALNETAALQIKDIILSKTDIPAEKITIIGVK